MIVSTCEDIFQLADLHLLGYCLLAMHIMLPSHQYTHNNLTVITIFCVDSFLRPQ